jgi:hypothetical protein
MYGFNFYGKYVEAFSAERKKYDYQPPTKSIILLSISQMVINAIQKTLTAPLNRIKILQQTMNLPQTPCSCTNSLIKDFAGNIINKRSTRNLGSKVCLEETILT